MDYFTIITSRTKNTVLIFTCFFVGYPMGPFELADYVGLDTTKFIIDGKFRFHVLMWAHISLLTVSRVSHFPRPLSYAAKVAFHLSVLAGRKELVLASLNGKVQGELVHFSRHNPPNFRALADWSGKTERH